MMKLRINKKKFIPNWKEYVPVLISALINFFIVYPFLEQLFPILLKLNPLQETIVYAILIVYIKDIIDFSLNGREYF